MNFPKTRHPLGRFDAWGYYLIERKICSGRDAAAEWESNQLYALNVVLEGEGTLFINGTTRIPIRPGSVYQNMPEEAGQGIRITWGIARPSTSSTSSRQTPTTNSWPSSTRSPASPISAG